MDNITNENYWETQRRRICLAAGVVNLNAGTCSPTCRDALDHVLALTRQQAEDPVEFIFRQVPVMLETTRAALAAAVHCSPRDLVLFTNATAAINTVARALKLERGDEVLMTDQEYHHYQPLWDEVCAAAGARQVKMHLPLAGAGPELTPEAVVELFAAAITPRTRVLYFSQVTSSTGMALPARELCAMARARGITTFVDGAHGLGLVPVDLAVLQPDYYAANVHKWMMAHPGAALLYVAPRRRAGHAKHAGLKPLVITGYSVFQEEQAEQSIGHGGPARWQYAHEYQGTRDLVSLLAAPAAVRFHGVLGLDAITERTRALAALCRSRLSALGLPVASHAHPELTTCMSTFRVPSPNGQRIDPQRAWRYMRRQHQIEVNFSFLNDGTPLLRVSTAWFNTVEDIERLAEVLGTLNWGELV